VGCSPFVQAREQEGETPAACARAPMAARQTGKDAPRPAGADQGKKSKGGQDRFFSWGASMIITVNERWRNRRGGAGKD